MHLALCVFFFFQYLKDVLCVSFSLELEISSRSIYTRNSARARAIKIKNARAHTRCTINITVIVCAIFMENIQCNRIIERLHRTNEMEYSTYFYLLNIVYFSDIFFLLFIPLHHECLLVF